MPRPDADAGHERTLTVRQALRLALERGPCTAHELSALASISEKSVAHHLEHLARSVEATGETLVVEPAECLACGRAFRDRRRFTVPGRCPRCRSEQIRPPRFCVRGDQAR